jgi:uncharacterized iron-regulated protein
LGAWPRQAFAQPVLNRASLSSAALLCAFLTACAAPGTRERSAAEPRIRDVRAERFVTEPQLVAALTVARYRLLGEVHDNPAHHIIRARLISAIAATGARPAVVFEQFDLDGEQGLVAAQQAGADAEQLVDAGGLDRRSWRWPLHKPIVEAALAMHLPLRAGNLARVRLRGDLQVGIDQDSNAIGYARFHAARWTQAQAAELHADIVEGHCGKLPEVLVPRLVLAQRLRDATMAQSLVDDATASGSILIAGNGHVRADLGVPVYLHAPGFPDAGARSISVGFIEVRAQDELAVDFPRRVIAEHPGFDYLWLTPAVARDDPCGESSR